MKNNIFINYEFYNIFKNYYVNFSLGKAILTMKSGYLLKAIALDYDIKYVEVESGQIIAGLFKEGFTIYPFSDLVGIEDVTAYHILKGNIVLNYNYMQDN